LLIFAVHNTLSDAVCVDETQDVAVVPDVESQWQPHGCKLGRKHETASVKETAFLLKSGTDLQMMFTKRSTQDESV
jgi:hypothetical protein